MCVCVFGHRLSSGKDWKHTMDNFPIKFVDINVTRVGSARRDSLFYVVFLLFLFMPKLSQEIVGCKSFHGYNGNTNHKSWRERASCFQLRRDTCADSGSHLHWQLTQPIQPLPRHIIVSHYRWLNPLTAFPSCELNVLQTSPALS